jgi:hypothetical protein
MTRVSSQRQRFSDLPPQKQAGILCGDPRFQNYAAQARGFPADTFNNSAAAEFLRQFCGIDSRRELLTSECARNKLQILITEFRAWVGEISSPR